MTAESRALPVRRPAVAGSLLMVLAMSAGAAAAAEPAPRPERPIIVLRQGDQPPSGDGLPVAGIGLATTDGQGRLGLAGTLDAAAGLDAFVWREDGIVWRASDVSGSRPQIPSPLIGVGDDLGQFVLRAAVDDLDSVWSHAGLLLQQGQPAPGLGDAATIVLSRWTTMTTDGAAYWISEFEDGPGPLGVGRVLYRSPTATPDAIEVVLRSDDLVDGLPIARPYGLDLNYQVSANGEHLAQILRLDTGSTDDDEAVYVDGTLALREGEVTATNDRWERFLKVAINSDGDFLASGETDAANGRDTVLAFNGSIALREGQLVDRRVLAASAAVLAVALDDEGRAAHLWSVGGFDFEYLFFACDAARLEDSLLVARTRQALELEDETLNIAIDHFSDVGHGPALRLGPGDRLYVAAVLREKIPPSGSTTTEAILSLPLPSCPTPEGAAPAANDSIESGPTRSSS